jgi:hypothetical protein
VGSSSPPPGPTLSCQSNFVVTDIMRVSISTFAPCVSDVCMKTSILRDSTAHTDVMRRAKIARRPAQVNHSRPIAAWGAATTIGFGRRGPTDGYRSRGSHELSIQEALFRGSTRRRLRSNPIRRMLRPISHWPIATTPADAPRQTWRLMHPRMLPERLSDGVAWPSAIVLRELCAHARGLVCMRDTGLPAWRGVLHRLASCSGWLASGCARSTTFLHATPIHSATRKFRPK